MINLAGYGFLDVDLKENCENICDIVPRCRDIARLGVAQQIQGQEWRFLERTLGEPATHVGWYLADLYREGTYGKIYKAFRMVVKRRPDSLFDVIEAPTEVVVKKTEPPTGSSVLPGEDVQAHTSEGLLHVLAWKTLQSTATPWAVPRPYEVFGDHSDALPGWRSMSLCMSYVNGRTMYSFLRRYWRLGAHAENGRILMEMLAQIAYILYNLQTELRLNHRDVKINNILVRRRKATEPPVLLNIDGGAHMLATQFELTLIDFGFACVGCPPPRVPNTVFQAGSWFPPGELCCKLGRDIAQLLFCIHCYYPLEDYLAADLVALLRGWLQVSWTGGTADILHGFTKEGHPRRTGAKGPPEFNTGIYEFLRRPEVDPPTCGPSAVFAACCRYLSAMPR
jgi:serine/threonine protein kinase